MTIPTRPRMRSRLADNAFVGNAGYSLVEMMVAMGVTMVVMGATLGGLSDVSKGSDMVVQATEMNKALRTGMDMMVRDMMQVGSGLPPGHVINVASGAGSSAIKMPGPPGTAYTLAAGTTDISAVQPGPGLGPVINGVATDIVTTLMADNNFLDEPLSAITNTTVTVAAGPNIATGPDRVQVGQLMMIYKGIYTTLNEVTAVNTTSRLITFSNGDSLNLNQSGAAAGNLTYINAQAPVNSATGVLITRIRMVTYYLDATTDPLHPRLVRRINNGDPLIFSNTSGTAISLDVENLTFRFDLNDGNLNPASVQLNAADLAGTGACSPNPCSTNEARKVDIVMTSRSANALNPKARSFHNTLTTQVSFRGMAFVDSYTGLF